MPNRPSVTGVPSLSLHEGNKRCSSMIGTPYARDSRVLKNYLDCVCYMKSFDMTVRFNIGASGEM
jgi:hypothetical protein